MMMSSHAAVRPPPKAGKVYRDLGTSYGMLQFHSFTFIISISKALPAGNVTFQVMGFSGKVGCT